MAKYIRRRTRSIFTGLSFLLLLTCLGYFFYAQFDQPASPKIIGVKELPAGFKSHGIDVSRYQGNIDWEQFQNNSNQTISFVYCKATEGVNHVDKLLTRNTKALRKRKIKFGVYHFFTPSQSGELQAKHFLKNYSYRKSELPPVLDVETESVSDQLLIERMKIWLKLVERKTGVKPVIYTSYHFYSTKFKNEFLNYNFWIANYSDKAERMTDERIIHWQYSDNGRIPGIEGAVDLNFSKQSFN